MYCAFHDRINTCGYGAYEKRPQYARTRLNLKTNSYCLYRGWHSRLSSLHTVKIGKSVATIHPECTVANKVCHLYLNVYKKDVNRDSHIASSPISQSSFFKKVRCLILASSQRKLCGYIEFFYLMSR